MTSRQALIRKIESDANLYQWKAIVVLDDCLKLYLRVEEPRVYDGLRVYPSAICVAMTRSTVGLI